MQSKEEREKVKRNNSMKVLAAKLRAESYRLPYQNIYSVIQEQGPETSGETLLHWAKNMPDSWQKTAFNKAGKDLTKAKPISSALKHLRRAELENTDLLASIEAVDSFAHKGKSAITYLTNIVDREYNQWREKANEPLPDYDNDHSNRGLIPQFLIPGDPKVDKKFVELISKDVIDSVNNLGIPADLQDDVLIIAQERSATNPDLHPSQALVQVGQEISNEFPKFKLTKDSDAKQRTEALSIIVGKMKSDMRKYMFEDESIDLSPEGGHPTGKMTPKGVQNPNMMGADGQELNFGGWVKNLLGFGDDEDPRVMVAGRPDVPVGSLPKLPSEVPLPRSYLDTPPSPGMSDSKAHAFNRSVFDSLPQEQQAAAIFEERRKAIANGDQQLADHYTRILSEMSRANQAGTGRDVQGVVGGQGYGAKYGSVANDPNAIPVPPRGTTVVGRKDVEVGALPAIQNLKERVDSARKAWNNDPENDVKKQRYLNLNEQLKELNAGMVAGDPRVNRNVGDLAGGNASMIPVDPRLSREPGSFPAVPVPGYEGELGGGQFDDYGRTPEQAKHDAWIEQQNREEARRGFAIDYSNVGEESHPVRDDYGYTGKGPSVDINPEEFAAMHGISPEALANVDNVLTTAFGPKGLQARSSYLDMRNQGLSHQEAMQAVQSALEVDRANAAENFRGQEAGIAGAHGIPMVPGIDDRQIPRIEAQVDANVIGQNDFSNVSDEELQGMLNRNWGLLGNNDNARAVQAEIEKRNRAKVSQYSTMSEIELQRLARGGNTLAAKALNDRLRQREGMAGYAQTRSAAPAGYTADQYKEMTNDQLGTLASSGDKKAGAYLVQRTGSGRTTTMGYAPSGSREDVFISQEGVSTEEIPTLDWMNLESSRLYELGATGNTQALAEMERRERVSFAKNENILDKVKTQVGVSNNTDTDDAGILKGSRVIGTAFDGNSSVYKLKDGTFVTLDKDGNVNFLDPEIQQKLQSGEMVENFSFNDQYLQQRFIEDAISKGYSIDQATAMWEEQSSSIAKPTTAINEAAVNDEIKDLKVTPAEVNTGNETVDKAIVNTVNKAQTSKEILDGIAKEMKRLGKMREKAHNKQMQFGLLAFGLALATGGGMQTAMQAAQMGMTFGGGDLSSIDRQLDVYEGLFKEGTLTQLREAVKKDYADPKDNRTAAEKNLEMYKGLLKDGVIDQATFDSAVSNLIGASGSQAGSVPKTTTAKLEELDKLLADGKINQAEYDSLRGTIISGSSGTTGTPSNLQKELDHLKSLFEAGTITEAQYKAAVNERVNATQAGVDATVDKETAKDDAVAATNRL